MAGRIKRGPSRERLFQRGCSSLVGSASARRASPRPCAHRGSGLPPSPSCSVQRRSDGHRRGSDLLQHQEFGRVGWWPEGGWPDRGVDETGHRPVALRRAGHPVGTAAQARRCEVGALLGSARGPWVCKVLFAIPGHRSKITRRRSILRVTAMASKSSIFRRACCCQSGSLVIDR